MVFQSLKAHVVEVDVSFVGGLIFLSLALKQYRFQPIGSASVK